MTMRTTSALGATVLLVSVLSGCTATEQPDGTFCTPEHKRCTDNNIETCNSSGSAWIYYRSCETGQHCIAGACVDVPESCGRGGCEASEGESCETCPEDCGPCCGNRQCDQAFNESHQSCPEDCPAITDGGGDNPAPDQPQASGAPQILSLLSNVASITEGESVVVTAVVTDPDGIDDLIGGTLTDINQASYGAFTTTAQEGSYQVTITWAAMSQIEPISFGYGQTEQRPLVATFYDQKGHTTSSPVSITLTCKGLEACSGTCLDTMVDSDNCGSCDHTCPRNTYAQDGCFLGKCADLSPCEDHTASSTCAARCNADGKVCHELCTNAGSTSHVGGVLYFDSGCGIESSNSYGCNEAIPGSSSYALRCCCF